MNLITTKTINTVGRVTILDIERLAGKFRIDSSGCWIWQPAPLKSGYGQCSFQGRNWRAHRLMYLIIHRQIADGLVLDHLCRVLRCVNPHHLEPVTVQENALRGKAAKRTHCPHGHEYTEENTWSSKSKPTTRVCKACMILKQRRRRQRLAEQKMLGAQL